MSKIDTSSYVNNFDYNTDRRSFDSIIMNVVDTKTNTVLGSKIIDTCSLDFLADEFMTEIVAKHLELDVDAISVESTSVISNEITDDHDDFKDISVVKSWFMTSGGKNTAAPKDLVAYFTLIDGYEKYAEAKERYENEEERLQSLFKSDVKKAYGIDNKIFAYVTRNIIPDINRTAYMEKVIKEIEEFEAVTSEL